MTDLQKLDFIVKYLEEIYNICLSDRSRKSRVIGLRWVYYNLSREFTKITYEDIGGKVGFDHGTVLHHCKKIKPRNEWLKIYAECRIACENIFKRTNKNATVNSRLIKEIKNLKLELQREKDKNKKEGLENRLLGYFYGLDITRKMDLITKAEILLKFQNKFKAA